MLRRTLSLFLVTACCIGLASIPLAAGEVKEQSNPAMIAPLRQTHLLTLILSQGGETHEFSMTIASRHFTMQLGEKSIGLKGRLWQRADSPMMLDYTLEFTHWIDGPGEGKRRSGSTWNGGTQLVAGKPVEIVRFLDGSFTVRIDPIE